MCALLFLVKNLSKFFGRRCTLPTSAFLSPSRHKPMLFAFHFESSSPVLMHYSYLSIRCLNLGSSRKHAPKNTLGSLSLSSWSAADAVLPSLDGPPLHSLSSSLMLSFTVVQFHYLVLSLRSFPPLHGSLRAFFFVTS
jgi:hypothetical protein